MSRPCPFFGDVPGDHRTAWGERAARALGAALEALHPSGTTGSIGRKRGGGLLIVVSSADGEHQMEIDCSDVDAEVRGDGETRSFLNPSELVEHVVQRVSRWNA